MVLSEFQLDPGKKQMIDPEEKPISVPSSEYTQEYYETGCDGHKEYNQTQGKILPPRLQMPLDLAGLNKNDIVLDFGCGRGEIVYQSTIQGAKAIGIDYSTASILIARTTLENNLQRRNGESFLISQSNGENLPFPSDTFDVVFMLDVVEHLYPKQLARSLNETKRVLKIGGKAIIHTMPNLWYYYYGYPIYRTFQNVRGMKLPTNPRLRWTHSHTHVNEQTPTSLRKALLKAGFSTRIWLMSTQKYSDEGNRFVRAVMVLLTKYKPLNYIFCNDIFAI